MKVLYNDLYEIHFLYNFFNVMTDDIIFMKIIFLIDNIFFHLSEKFNGLLIYIFYLANLFMVLH